MILISSDVALGSKAFMHKLAEAMRPALADVWNADVLEDFDLDLLQEMIHFGDLSAADFNAAANVIGGVEGVDKTALAELLAAMKADSRFETS